MYGCKFYLEKKQHILNTDTSNYLFLTLVISTLFIAAAGNIINDYFDVKADRVNKPYKMIINRSLKRRWAIMLHWIFNFCGFFLAVIIGSVLNSLWFVVIHLISINMLWFYSLFLKKKAVIGNMIIGLLTALIPVLVIIFFEISYLETNPDTLNSKMWYLHDAYKLLWMLCLFAFIQNFAREILKDIEDIKGDKLIYVRSLPMIIGIRKTQITIAFILLIPVCIYIYFFSINAFSQIGLNSINSLGFGVASVLNLVVIIRLLLSNKNEYFWNNQLIKLSMLFGLMTTFHASFIQ